jgi:hypothetical protein
MKATKYSMTVKVEVLSIDVIPQLLADVQHAIRGEDVEGMLRASDGDEVSWSLKSEQVEI